MPQASGATAEKSYPLLLHPDVLKKLETETANRYQTLRSVIDGLQFNPWPQGAEADEYSGPGFARLERDDIQPRTLFFYRVEDDRVTIIYYEERNFPRG
jgi:hypothetical protein